MLCGGLLHTFDVSPPGIEPGGGVIVTRRATSAFRWRCKCLSFLTVVSRGVAKENFIFLVTFSSLVSQPDKSGQYFTITNAHGIGSNHVAAFAVRA